MGPRQPERRSNSRITVRRMLVTYFFCLALACASTVVLSQEESRTPRGSLSNARAPSASATTMSQRAPDAVSYPFLRLVGVLLSGLAISAARLAHKFRRFLGLGVFTNPYSALFLLFGLGICGIPVTSESAVSSLPHLETLGPWIADFSGIVVALMLPAIRFQSDEHHAAETQVRGLEAASSSNPILAVIEDGIRDHILQRMQAAVVDASKHYDWETIKLAARNALEIEMTMRPLAREDYDAVHTSIEHFEQDADARLDSQNRYEALIQLLRWCSFKQLGHELETAAKECHP